jgi:hypothetical protein
LAVQDLKYESRRIGRFIGCKFVGLRVNRKWFNATVVRGDQIVSGRSDIWS